MGRFSPPWAVEESEACFIVKDHAGQSPAYVYFKDEPGRRAAAKLLTRDKARRIAANVAKLPDLLQRSIPFAEQLIHFASRALVSWISDT